MTSGHSHPFQIPTWLLYLSAILIWGTTFLAIKYQLGVTRPEISVGLRFLLASLLLFLVCMVRKERLRYSGKEHTAFIFQGFFSFTLSYMFTYAAENYLVSGLVAVLFSLMVFWNAFGSRLVFGAKLRPSVIAAAFLGVFGVACMFVNEIRDYLYHTHDPSTLTSVSGSSAVLTGVLYVLCSTFSSSAGNIVAAYVMKKGISSLASTTWSMFWGAAFVVFYIFIRGIPFELDKSLSYQASLIYLSVFGSVIAFWSYFTLVGRVGPSKSSYVGVMTPVLSVALSVMFEGYSVHLSSIFGMFLCIFGLIISVRSKQNQQEIRST